MVLWVVAHNSELASAEAMLADANEQMTQLDILLARKSNMDARRDRLARLEQLVSELRPTASLAVILSDLSRRMPDSVMLTDLAIESASIRRFVAKPASDKQETAAKDASKDAPTPPMDETRLVVSGLAMDVSDAIKFSAALEASALFEDVQMTLKGMGEWGGRRGEGFEVTCVLPTQTRTTP